MYEIIEGAQVFGNMNGKTKVGKTSSCTVINGGATFPKAVELLATIAQKRTASAYVSYVTVC